MANWLDELKIGDEVVCSNDEIVKVTKIHKLHVICGDRKFNKKYGKLVGSHGYWSRYIMQATPELKARIKEKNILRQLYIEFAKYHIRKAKAETIVKIIALLKADKEERDATK